MTITPWTKLHPLSDKNAFICLVDHMGDDSSIVQAARVSYGKDEQEQKSIGERFPYPEYHGMPDPYRQQRIEAENALKNQNQKDRQLIRYLLNHGHTTPFEMVEIKFMVQVPMDCWRQWIRHRTANVNEYSTRYTEALDMQQTTLPGEWRLQATDNKQGSSGYLEDWPEGFVSHDGMEDDPTDYYVLNGNKETTPDSIYYHDLNLKAKPGEVLSELETTFHESSKTLYQQRLALGVAKEQARKDLPLSTYTRAYWKCDLHNIFNFLRLRMDSHAQLEIRQFANCMFEIVKSICPVACEAFEDYVLHAKKFSRMEMKVLKKFLHGKDAIYLNFYEYKPNSMTDREWKEFLGKLS